MGHALAVRGDGVHEAGRVRMGPYEVQVGQDHGSDAGTRVGRPGQRRQQGLEELAQRAVCECGEHAVETAEVVVDASRTDPTGLGDGAERETGLPDEA